ncbi:hypothetical protein E3N88_43701 [Mikania micrantha]|uniref:Protein kinase domain-containing protein n=1 Tax=Mikania micrantha TaxID=192012 RepID=A0A5N6LE70_9ASTR|nr:hypothetical protein E3N88_43701 [Mikania micrantha]
MQKNPLFFILVIFFSLFIAGKPDLNVDRSAILAIRSSVGGRSILWNISQPATPCTWPGVVCDNKTNRVVELHFPGMGLSGELPANTLGNLTQLTTLSLRYNALSGQLPADIFKLVNLRNLFLQNNLFSGEIPDSFSPMANLVRVSFAGNNFSGEIPKSVSNLTRLATLYLENNALTGSIPDLTRTNIALFNVSNNKLTGEIPSKLSGFPDSSFAGNSLCGNPLTSCNGSQSGSSSHSSNKLSGGAIAGIVIGSVLGLLLILVILFFLCCKNRKHKVETTSKDLGKTEQVEIEMPKENSKPKSKSAENADSFLSLTAAAGDGGDGGAKALSGEVGKKLIFFKKNKDLSKFDLDDLLRASAEVLGKGAFGTAYNAVLETGFAVVVKRLKDATMADKEFAEKIAGVGAMDHENLVPLRAYYCNGEEKLIVYDYMPMGSLSALLHGIRMLKTIWFNVLQLAIDCCAQYPDKRPVMVDVANHIAELCGSSGSQPQEPKPLKASRFTRRGCRRGIEMSTAEIGAVWRPIPAERSFPVDWRWITPSFFSLYLFVPLHQILEWIDSLNPPSDELSRLTTFSSQFSSLLVVATKLNTRSVMAREMCNIHQDLMGV